jgi:hypothetical protein
MEANIRGGWVVNSRRRLEKYLDELITTRVFLTRRQIAEECGLTDAGLSLILSNPRRRFTMEQCLRLARKLQEDPVGVLRLMGRPDAAALLDDLWPRKSNYLAITQSEREVIKQWRDMTSNDRYHFLALLTISADRERASTHGRRGPRPVKKRRVG